MTTDQVFDLREVPESVLIVGANEVGLKFAFIFNAFGSAVTLIDSADRILPSEDADIAATLRRSIKKRGITLLTTTTMLSLGGNENGKTRVVLRTGEKERGITVEKVLLTDRRPNTEALGLEKVGVRLDNGTIVVNDRMETSVPGLYAAGDVTGGCYAHTAFAEGVTAAENALGQTATKPVASLRSVFSHPEVACVGLTEAQARSQSHDVRVGKFMFLANGGALVTRNPEGLVKVIAEAETGEILGVHIIGPRATDLIPGAVLGMSLEAAIEDVANTPYLHPTLAEALKEAALDALGRPIHKAK
jgi:dihydrolipoamide dehydrogenase